MAGAKSGVHVLQLKRPEVPECLQKGQRFFKYDDVRHIPTMFLYYVVIFTNNRSM